MSLEVNKTGLAFELNLFETKYQLKVRGGVTKQEMNININKEVKVLLLTISLAFMFLSFSVGR